MEFHFEADTTLVREWSDAFSELIAAREPEWAGSHPGHAAEHGPAADAVGLAIARAWVAAI